jgi:hypothetical protein
MRTACRGSISSLAGSLALHGWGLLLLFIGAHRQAAPPVPSRVSPDAWLGGAFEVAMIASADTTPDGSQTASALAQSESPRAGEPSSQARARSTSLSAAVSSQLARAKAMPLKPSAGHVASSPKPSASTLGAGNPEATPGAGAGAFGAQGLAAGVRNLPNALTRAIPPATNADPIWQSLPAGPQRPFTLAVAVDAEGHIGATEILAARDGSSVLPQFEHLRQRLAALLGGGLFALQDNVAAGSDLFRITITLSDRAVPEDGAPAELVERGFEPPRGSSAGRAYFTLASGRHFEAKVEVLPARVHP